jgi:hypothetical protein
VQPKNGSCVGCTPWSIQTTHVWTWFCVRVTTHTDQIGPFQIWKWVRSLKLPLNLSLRFVSQMDLSNSQTNFRNLMLATLASREDRRMHHVRGEHHYVRCLDHGQKKLPLIHQKVSALLFGGKKISATLSGVGNSIYRHFSKLPQNVYV